MNGIANPFERFELKIMEAGHDQVDSSWHRFVTFFPYYRLYYIVSGHAVIYLQEQMLELKPGHMYYVPAFSLFDAHCDQILDHYWIHFNFDATAEKYLTICPPRYEATPRPSDEAIFRLATELARLPAEEKHLPDVVAAESLSKYLFSRFLPDEEELASSDAVRFIPVLQYIDENFSKKITNEDLSAIVYLTPNYFSNLFTRRFGVSPQKYILQKRLNLAAAMLFERGKSIKEIAFACGFENETYFNRQFHRVMGMSPGKYRKVTVPLNG